MVNRSYLLQEPPPPSASKLVFDLKVVPFLVNIAALVETQLEGFAVQARARPLPALAAAFASGCLLDALIRPRGG